MNPETTALRISVGASLLVGVVGLGVATIAASQAVLLDGVFNLIYFVMSLLSLKVARLIQRTDDERFPFGYAYFEPLINTTKGLLILGVAALALIDAIRSLFTGGREIVAGAAIGYALFAMLIGLATAAVQARLGRKSASPLVAADVKNWAINGALSSVIALGFGGVFLIRGTSYEYFDRYVDPGLVALLVLLTFVVPLKMVRDGLLELVNAAPDSRTVNEVQAAIDRVTSDLAPSGTVVRTLRVGRTLYALVHLVMDPESDLDLAGLDRAREKIAAGLLRERPDLAADIVFTTDERWAFCGSAES